jgi:hypothetical protein
LYKNALTMPDRYPGTPFLTQLTAQLQSFSKQRYIQNCYLKPVDRHLESGIPGIVARLAKAGLSAFVNPDLSVRYPRAYLLSAAPEGTLLFVRPEKGISLAKKFPQFILAGKTPNCVVLWSSSSAQPSPFTFSFEDLALFTLKSRGFYPAERAAESRDAFRWSSGAESELLLTLPTDCDYRLRLVVRPFLAPDKQQSLTLFFNDHRVEELHLSSEPEWQELTLVIPRRYLREVNQIAFRYQYCASPRDLGISDDNRVLAVAFKSLTLEKIL